MDIKELNSKAENFKKEFEEDFKDSREYYEEFLSLYPYKQQPEMIDSITPETIYNPGKKPYFLYYIEHKLDDFGRVRVGQAKYAENARDQIDEFKELLKIVVDDSLSISEKVDAPWEDIKFFGGDKNIAKKIIFCYNPLKVLPVYKTEHLEHFANLIDKEFKSKVNTFNKPYENLSLGQKFEYLNDIILKFKEDEIEDEMDNVCFMHFLYTFLSPSEYRNSGNEAENELKRESSKIKYFIEKLLRSYSLNLKRGLKQVEKNFGAYLTGTANYYTNSSFESEVFEGDQPYFILYNGYDNEEYVDYPYFIAYFFKKRSKECYLTLNINRRYLSTILGNAGKFSGYYDDNFQRILSNLASSLRSELPENSFSNQMNLYSSEDPKWFSLLKHGTVCAIKYDLDNLPSEEELESDFRDILDFYNNLDVYSEEDLDVNELEPSHVDTAEDSDVMPENFFEYLSEKGYFFEQELVENFLLSLKVKPFVIMTGNSGTGKTKLAQLFAQFKNSQRNTGKIDKISIGVDITTLSKRRFGEWDIGEKEYEMLKDFSDNLTLEIHRDRSKSSIGGRGYLKGHKLYYKPGTPFYDEIESIKVGSRTRIYVMAEDYGKSKNYEVVPVGANWTENRHIVGFYNVITEEYEKTPALDLIMNANNIAEANFLILDEMNLSHVERYFSDFLSAMESGEKIPLHQNDDINFPQEIEKLPENLCIIGTVNVDETTYMFSPKVLDRANTIEFLTPSALDYMNGWRASNNHNGNLNYLENPLSDLEIRQSLILDIKELFEDVQTLGGRFWDVVSAEIFRFQELLKKAGFDFGFRVINEIMRFMYVSWVYEGKPQEWKNWKRYFDAQIKQKMLPRIHGSQRTLEGVLKDLYDLCSDYSSSKVKLEEMKDVLYKQRYVSFTN